MIETLEPRRLLAVVVPGGYDESVYTTLNTSVSALTVDASTGDLYFTERSTEGRLWRVPAEDSPVLLSSGFASGNTFAWQNTDIQYHAGMVYTALSDGALVQIDVGNVAGEAETTSLHTFTNFGPQAGLDVIGDTLYISDGDGMANTLWSYDLSTSTTAAVATPLTSIRGVEAGPDGELYVAGGRSLYRVNPATGSTSFLFVMPGADGNFAVDPSGEYLYTRLGNTVNRISLLTGEGETFMTELANDSDYDLAFGPSSTGLGQSLFVADAGRILEVSGFGLPADRPGSLQGTVWNDDNGNGIRDEGEIALGGITVYLDLNENGQWDADEPSTLTNDAGDYTFTDLAPGRYVVRDLRGDDTQQTSPGIDRGVYYGAAYVGSTGNVQVVQIDGASGEITWMGNPLSVRMHGMIVTNDGQMYGINGFEAGNDGFYRVDPMTGQTTLIGSTGYDLVWGLAYDAATDTIYGLAATNPAANVNSLVTFNRANGQVSVIGSGISGMSGTSGLTFDPLTRRIIAFANNTDEFYAFSTDGTASKIGQAAGLNTWSLAHNGQDLVTQWLNINNRTILVTVDPQTGQWATEVQMPHALTLESLEWVGSPQFAHAVYLEPGQSINGVDFGHQRLIADAGDTYVIAQGESLALSGAATGADGMALTYQWDLNGDGHFDTAGSEPVLQWTDLAALGINDGTHTIGLRVSDGARIAEDSATLIVNNTLPVITEVMTPGIGQAIAGEEASVMVSFDDPGMLDLHIISVDWGDGVTTSHAVDQGNRTVELGHRYSTGGAYTVQVTVHDGFGTGESVSSHAFVTGVGLHNGVLHVVGNAEADTVAISRPRNKWLQIDAATIPGAGNPLQESAVESILVWLGNGNNRFSMHSALKTPVAVVGGEGDDHIQAGGGRNLLIGGAGSDTIVGGSNEDILIAGSTAFDHNSAALLAILREWNSSRSYEQRVENLVRGTGSANRLNGDYFLLLGAGGTVFDDDSADTLTGGKGRDWYFFDDSLDSVTDLAADEVIGNDLDYMLNPPPATGGNGNGNGKGKSK